MLAHEATFAANHARQAERKRHSTVLEALDAALAMVSACVLHEPGPLVLMIGVQGAYRTILTHLSARHPWGHTLPSDHAATAGACVAYDGMVVSFEELSELPQRMRGACAAVEKALVCAPGNDV